MRGSACITAKAVIGALLVIFCAMATALAKPSPSAVR
jgi:hypothetical protein